VIGRETSWAVVVLERDGEVQDEEVHRNKFIVSLQLEMWLMAFMTRTMIPSTLQISCP
jgi:hypothetical protein